METCHICGKDTLRIWTETYEVFGRIDNEMWAMCNPWKTFGIMIGKNNIPITASMLTVNMLLLRSMNAVSDIGNNA